MDGSVRWLYGSYSSILFIAGLISLVLKSSWSCPAAADPACQKQEICSGYAI